jgi:hypothetical protein
MITHWEFPPDVRVELEALALIANGHSVSVYANAKQSFGRFKTADNG